MDDRRRTISSEESMIGEALMRVSNTLEAERLTKSLDYQEKLRSRSNIRLILSIICLVIAVGMLLIGGLLLIVLVKYEDPVLDTLVPFLKGFFNGLNTLFQSSVEASTYLPALARLGTEALGIGVNALNGLSSMDLSGVMSYLTSILGTTAGMLSDTRTLLGNLGSQAGPMIGQLSSAVSELANGGLTSGLNDTISSLGVNMKDVANINSSLIGTISSVASDLSSTLNDPATKEAVNTVANATTGLVSSSSDLLSNLNTAAASFNNNIDYAALGDAAGQAASAGANIANASVGVLNSLTNALAGFAGVLGG